MPDPGPQEPPLFHRRMPLLQLLQTKQMADFDRYMNHLPGSWTHYHQMMLLAAGIIGVVIPILGAQRPMTIHPWFAKRAMLSFGGTIVFGTLIQGIGRWLTVWMSYLMAAHTESVMARVWTVEETEDAARVAVFSPTPALWRLLRWTFSVIGLGFIGDLLFYGSFIGGVIYLARGIAGV